MDPVLLNQLGPPVNYASNNDDPNVRIRKRDKIRKFFCLGISKPDKDNKATKGKDNKATKGISNLDHPPSPSPNGSASQSPANPTSVAAQVKTYSPDIGNTAAPNSPLQNGSVSQSPATPIFNVVQVNHYYSGDNQSVRSTGTTQGSSASHQSPKPSHQSPKPSSIVAPVNNYPSFHNQSFSSGTTQGHPRPLRSKRSLSVVSQGNSDFPESSQFLLPSIEQNRCASLQSASFSSTTTQVENEPLNSTKSVLLSGSVQDEPAFQHSTEFSPIVTQFDNELSDSQSLPIVVQMDIEPPSDINSVPLSITVQDESTSLRSESSSSIATQADNEVSDDSSYSTPPSNYVQDESAFSSPISSSSTATHIDDQPSDNNNSAPPSSSLQKESAFAPPTSSSSTVTQVGDDLSAESNSVLSSGAQKDDFTSQQSMNPTPIVTEDNSEYSSNSKCDLSPTCVPEESPSHQPEKKPSSIVTNFDDDYWSNSKSTVSPGTVQYVSPSLQARQPSRIRSKVGGEPSPSDPPNLLRTPRVSRTVQDTNAMHLSSTSSSHGHDYPSSADRSASPRTVQDTYAMNQITRPSSNISQGGHSPLTNNQSVTPAVSQPVPSSGNQRPLSVDSLSFPSGDNQSIPTSDSQSVSSSDSQSIYSCDSQFTSNMDSQSTYPCDNQPLPINNNQCVACGDIQPVSSSAEENTSLSPFPTDTQSSSALPEEQFQTYAEQQTSPPTLDSHSLVGEVLVTVFTSDGRHIISCPRHQGLEKWDSQTGARVPLPLEMTGGVCTFAISPSGAQVATGCFDGSIRLWHGQTYAAERVLLGHTYTISKLAYSPCSRWLVSCDMSGTVRLWDLLGTDDQGEIVETGTGVGGFKDVVFPLTGYEFRTLSDCLVRFYDPRYRNPCTVVLEVPLDNPIYPLDYSQDDLRIVFGSGFGSYSIHVNDPELRKDFELEGHGHEVVCAAFSPCGTGILSSSRDKTVRLWLDKVNSWFCAAVVPEFSETITCLAWNPVVPLEFVTGCRDGSVRVWRVSSDEGDVSVNLIWGTDVTGLTSKDVADVDPIDDTSLVLNRVSEALSTQSDIYAVSTLFFSFIYFSGAFHTFFSPLLLLLLLTEQKNVLE